MDRNANSENQPASQWRPSTTEPAGTLPIAKLLALGVLGIAVIGLIMTQQSASLLTGTGTQWTGAILAVIAVVAAVVLRKNVSRWVIVVAAVLAALSLASVVYLEVQMEQRRQEIGQIFD